MTFKDTMKKMFSRKERVKPEEQEEEEKNLEYSKSEEIEQHLQEKQQQLDEDIDFKEGALKAVNQVGLAASFGQDSLEYAGEDDKAAKNKDNFVLGSKRWKVWLSKHKPFRKREEKSKTADETLESLSDKIIKADLQSLEKNGLEVIELRKELAEKKKKLEKSIKDKEKELEKYIKTTKDSIDSIRDMEDYSSDLEKYEEEFEEAKNAKMAEIQDLKAELLGGEKSDGTMLEDFEKSSYEQVEDYKMELGIGDRIERYLLPAKEKISKLDELKLKYQEMLQELQDKKQKVGDDIKKFNNAIQKSIGNESPVKSIREKTEKLLEIAKEKSEQIEGMVKAINLRLVTIKTDIKEVNDLMIRVESVGKDSKEIAQMKKDRKADAGVEDPVIDKEPEESVAKKSVPTVTPAIPGESAEDEQIINMGDLELDEDDLRIIKNDSLLVDKDLKILEAEGLEGDDDEPDELNQVAMDNGVKKLKVKKNFSVKPRIVKEPEIISFDDLSSEAERGLRQEQKQEDLSLMVMSRDEWMGKLKITHENDKKLFIEECGQDNVEFNGKSARLHYIYFLKNKFPHTNEDELIKETNRIFSHIKDNPDKEVKISLEDLEAGVDAKEEDTSREISFDDLQPETPVEKKANNGKVRSLDKWMEIMEISDPADQELFRSHTSNNKLTARGAALNYFDYAKEKFPDLDDAQILDKLDVVKKK